MFNQNKIKSLLKDSYKGRDDGFISKQVLKIDYYEIIEIDYQETTPFPTPFLLLKSKTSGQRVRINLTMAKKLLSKILQYLDRLPNAPSEKDLLVKFQTMEIICRRPGPPYYTYEWDIQRVVL